MATDTLFCHDCGLDRPWTVRADGVHICLVCLCAIRCADCGAPYTANCAEGSVFVPAIEEGD